MPNDPNPPFDHFIMTRFNLATPGRELAIRTQEGWLDYRFDLFQRYCMPSIAEQTNTNFNWIIYFDKDTPSYYKNRIDALRKEVPFRAYYTGLFGAEGWKRSLFETFHPQSKSILTTRLDSDDVISTDFVQRLHDEIAAQDYSPGAYNFRKGLIRQGKALFQITHETNAFFSFMEPNGPNVRTAPSIQHMNIRQCDNLFQINDNPSWMQIIHESNVSNKVRGWRTNVSGLTSRFPEAAVAGLAQPSKITLLVENTLLAPWRFSRDAAINILRRGRTKG